MLTIEITAPRIPCAHCARRAAFSRAVWLLDVWHC